MLGADVVVSELQCFAETQFEHLLGTRRERDVAGRGCLALADDFLNLFANVVDRDGEFSKRLRGDAVALANKPEQDVLGSDVIVVELLCLFLGKHHDSTGPVGKSFKHLVISFTQVRGSLMRE
ncbi:unannotated protein [freshwater metagenome]|uniref:Unannotated protein n=1 Tax=freshwater metagenome TaxID=449393 RepID=A0A6J6FHF2_9ZZZZ